MGLSDIIATVRNLASGGVGRVEVVEAGELAIAQHRVSDDIRELLWFSDGPLCNYTPQAISESVSSFDGIQLKVSFFGPGEPSALSVKAAVVAPSVGRGAEPLGYYPSYEGMSPSQRWTYLNWLTDVDQPVDIGYVFVFYYGLERHLFLGAAADRAVDMILRLRGRHAHSSFTKYSSNALVAASLVAGRPDWLLKFALTVDSLNEVALSDVYLYAKCRHGFDLSATELMALSGRVGFTNRRYIKSETDLFESTLLRLIQSEFGNDDVPLARYPLAGCPRSLQGLFANISLDRDRSLLEVPVLVELPAFRDEMHALLAAAHDEVKQQLKTRRTAAKRGE